MFSSAFVVLLRLVVLSPLNGNLGILAIAIQTIHVYVHVHVMYSNFRNFRCLYGSANFTAFRAESATFSSRIRRSLPWIGSQTVYQNKKKFLGLEWAHYYNQSINH